MSVFELLVRASNKKGETVAFPVLVKADSLAQAGQKVYDEMKFMPALLGDDIGLVEIQEDTFIEILSKRQL